ncbi:hypothetical protein ABS767_10005 [Sphingomonas sp. ST-64]|uniref:Uncharacterized protein n=1 Tax=Sphingomonas plantiphila TaxID=3163295 RepID=A0ABW8YPC8_9SPHN
MTFEEWESSNNAPEMLAALHAEQPRFLRKQVPQLHRFLIACCWKHQNLIPQDGLRDGLRGAEAWIAGKISKAELNRLNWYAEADAFRIDYAKSPEEISEIRLMIDGIEELRQLPFETARQKLLDAAYFAEGSMIYPMIERLPWVESLLTSQFLCADLLRKYIAPHLAGHPDRKGSKGFIYQLFRN